MATVEVRLERQWSSSWPLPPPPPAGIQAQPTETPRRVLLNLWERKSMWQIYGDLKGRERETAQPRVLIYDQQAVASSVRVPPLLWSPRGLQG